MRCYTASLAGAAAAFSVLTAQAVAPDLGRFVTAKEKQVRDFAEDITNKVPALVYEFFDAVKVDDWATATNLAARLNRASGRYADSRTDERMSPALSSLIWPPISEVVGANEQFHNWDSKWLHRFGREIIDSIPRGSIYFGGTDPGRFVISVMCESQTEGKPFFTLTQNQLADTTYLDYLQRMYGARLQLPDTQEVQRVFEEYSTNAYARMQQGKLKPGENVRMVEGRITVSGETAVMEVNGLLARVVLDKNPERDVYIEESYPLEWMYSHLEPHGLIFQLHHKPLDNLSEDAVKRDERYWKNLTSEMIGDWLTEKTTVEELCDFSDRIYLKKDLTRFKGDKNFVKNLETQKCFAKLRTSMANLYFWRMEHAQSTDERKRMQNAAELACRQAFALCPLLPEGLYRYTKLLTDSNRSDDAFLVGKAALRLKPEDAYLKNLVRSLKP